MVSNAFLGLMQLIVTNTIHFVSLGNEVVDVCARMEKTSFRTAFIMSSGYPEAYGPSLECKCNITTDLDQRILLKFADYNLEWSENCENDVVQVSQVENTLISLPLPK